MSQEREVSRRHLMVYGGAACASALIGSSISPSAGAAAPKAPQVPRRVLGRTGKSIPILLMGGGAGFKGSFDGRIQVALEHGVNYIDTARSYAGGRSEIAAANTLHKLNARDKTWITSKTGRWSAGAFEQDVEQGVA